MYQGECDLSILVNGSDIRNSPFVVNFLPKPKLRILNKNVAELAKNKRHLNFPQQSVGPWGIAVGPNGHTFITDYYNQKIHVFDEQRKHIRSFGQKGNGPGQLHYPCGVAVDASGLVYVSNDCNNRIEVLREDGTFIKQIGVGHLSHPWGVAIDKKQVYVADNGNKRISIFTLKGQLIRTFGTPASGPGQLASPSSVAIAPNGDLYVTDFNKHRVQVYNSDCVYQRHFGEQQLKNPNGILITSDGHVLVADSANNRVVIFNTTGQIICSFQVGTWPMGLAINQNGDLFVVLHYDKQVAIF